MKCKLFVGLLPVLAAGFLPASLAAQVLVTPTFKPTPTGQLVVVNNGPADQTDPHVSGNLVVYSNSNGANSTIHYFDLATLTDKTIPSNDTTYYDYLPDVRVTTIVFTHVTPSKAAIFSFDAASGVLTEIAPAAGSSRQQPQIGDQTIAWQDHGFDSSGASSDIVAYDRQSGTTTRLANDSALNESPGISPDGTVIVWEKCATVSSPCAIWFATLSNGAWTAQQVSSPAVSEYASHPDTDGTIIAYSADAGSGDQLHWQPMSGGTDQVLNLQGGKGSTPSINGGLIAFSYLAANASNHEIALYDAANNVLYNLTADIGAQPGADKELNDISVTADGQVRIVWQAPQTDYNIYAYTFSVTAPRYALTDLGPMNISAAPSGPTGLNGSAQVAGFFFDLNVQSNQAFLWENGALNEFGTLGGASSFAYGINAAGQVVGTSDLSATAGYNTQRAFIWQNGVMSNLGDPLPDASNYSTAFGINSNGDVAGYQNDGAYHPVIWKAGVATGATLLTPLPCSVFVCQGEALAINDLGQAAGWSSAASGTHAVVWDSTGQPTDLGTFGNSTNNQANGINHQGVVVGYSQLDPNLFPATVHAFVWQSGSLQIQDLGAIPGPDPNALGAVDTNSSAWGINTKGDIVGISAPTENAVLFGGGGRAFLKSGGVMYDLTTLLLPGINWKLEAAWSINDSGQIVGVGFNPAGKEHGYLLAPGNLATTTAVVSSVNPSVFGQQVSFTATVSPTSSTSLTPSGNIIFSDGATVLGTVPLASGIGIYNTVTLSVGSHPITAAYSGDSNFASNTSTPLSQIVNQGATTTTVSASPNPGNLGQTVTLTAIVTPVAPAAGTPTGTVSFLDGTTHLGSGATLSVGQATLSTSSLTPGTHSITAVYSGDADFLTSTSSTLAEVVNQVAPTITWANPAAISYGTALSSTQLNATGSVPGTLAYSPAAGTVLTAGSHILSVTLTPTDTTDYTSATATVTQVVNQVTPTITWANPATISYGTALSGTQLNATGSVPGTLVYSPSAGTVPSAGSQTLSVTLTPTDATDYTTATASVILVVNQVKPTIAWANPAAIFYGTALSGTQLNATGSVPGTLVYSPAAGAVLSAGNQTLSVTLTPTDTSDYTAATASVTLVVNQVKPTITWANPAAISYGTALSGTQLNAVGSVPGTLVYSPAAGTVLTAGSQTLSVTLTPTDTINYTSATATVTQVVNQATPTITWANPAAISYGTPLSGTQLNATGSVPGTLIYSSAAGAVLSAGTQTLSVTFTPTDATDYTTATGSVTLVVTQVKPTITWANPAAISYSTPLSGTQLNATGSVPGKLVYSPAAGAVLSVGSDSLSVTLTPTDPTDYTPATATVTQVVNQDTPTIAWANPAAISYGTALSGTQLNATGSVPGTVAYSPAAGTVLTAGSHILSVTLTPTDTTDYTSATATVTQVVNQVTPTITWANPAAISYGTALSGTQLNATGSVPGTLVYSPAAGTVLTVGSHTLSVTLTPADTTDYTTATATVTIVVNMATSSTVLSTSATTIQVGQPVTFTAAVTGSSPTGTVQFKDGATNLGSPVTLSVGAAQLTTSALTVGIHTITAVYSGDANNAASTSNMVTVVANPSTPTINWATPAAITYGTALSATQLDASATFNGSSVAGTFVYTPALGAVLGAGSRTLSVVFTPTSNAYTSASGSVILQVNQATPQITWAKPAAITYGTGLSSVQLDATPSVPGSFVYSPSAGTVPSAGTATLSAIFSPTDSIDYTTANGSVTLTVNKASTTTTIAETPSSSYLGQLVTFTSSVHSASGITPTGTVTFKAGTTVLATVPLDNTGVATFTTSSLGAGSYSMMASYNGSANFAASTSMCVTETVSKLPTATSVTSSSNPSKFGSSVTFTGTVVLTPGVNTSFAGSPTGLVNFYDGTKKLGTGTLNGVGVTTFSTTTLICGSHKITAVYVGDAHFVASTSSVLLQTVK